MSRKKPIATTKETQTSNRARDLSRNNDTMKNVSIGLMDMDSAIMYYFDNIIKPEIVDNGEKVKVPILYASPERWFSIQKSGFMRDSKNQIILPAIVFRRTGVERDENIPVDKLDANNPKLHTIFEQKYTQNNRYDNFSVQQGLSPQRELYSVAVPDYVTLSYDFIIWTHYIEHMNKIVERINWSDGSYWGEPGKLKFRSRVESFNDVTELSDRERIVKTEFSVTLHGYLIPEHFNSLVTTKKYLTPKKLIISNETDIDITSLIRPDDKVQEVRVTGGTNRTLTTKTTLDNSITLTAGTGISIDNSGQPFSGENPLTYVISLGQQQLDAFEEDNSGNLMPVADSVINNHVWNMSGDDLSLKPNYFSADWEIPALSGSLGKDQHESVVFG